MAPGSGQRSPGLAVSLDGIQGSARGWDGLQVPVLTHRQSPRFHPPVRVQRPQGHGREPPRPPRLCLQSSHTSAPPVPVCQALPGWHPDTSDQPDWVLRVREESRQPQRPQSHPAGGGPALWTVELRAGGVAHNPGDVYLPIYLLLRGLRPPEERGDRGVCHRGGGRGPPSSGARLSL